MRLNHGHHLAYCTNIHCGEDLADTWAALKEYTLAVRDRVSPNEPYAIGLRLGRQAAIDLSQPDTLAAFKDWLATENCYVFTINGFPYGQFHNTRVKEQVYRPDWTTPERLDYTKQLFEIIAELVPDGVEGSVSTLPGSFKGFGADEATMFANLHACMEHIEAVSERTGKVLHLGMEPEPLGHFDTTQETVDFFDRFIAAYPADRDRILRTIGVNYDTCHLAIQYEDAADAIGRLDRAGIRISKFHLSSALSLKPTPEALARLDAFEEGTYLHQVAMRTADEVRLFKDLPIALDFATRHPDGLGEEWRVHFHVPVHAQPELLFGNTLPHLTDTLDCLAAKPELCTHLEMETYTWGVLPEALRSASVVDQLVKEYEWCLAEMKQVGLGEESEEG